jgi:hypothetical protein
MAIWVRFFSAFRTLGHGNRFLADRLDGAGCQDFRRIGGEVLLRTSKAALRTGEEAAERPAQKLRRTRVKWPRGCSSRRRPSVARKRNAAQESERAACGSSLKESLQKASAQKRVGAERRLRRLVGGIFYSKECAHRSSSRDLRIVARANLTRSCAPDSLADACERRRGDCSSSWPV